MADSHNTGVGSNNQTSNKTNGKTIVISSMSKSLARKYSCGRCPEAFATQQNLDEHKVSAHTFKCMKCPKLFEIKKDLQEHLIVEHYFKCEECDLVFDSKSKMSDHNDKEHTFRCNECAQIFTSEAKRSDHIKSAHQTCDTCEDEFSWAEPDHSCYYTRTNTRPSTDRVIVQRLYQGYFFTSSEE